ncbi:MULTISPECIES: CHAT domain-containing protein [unclassified Nostoc]|uniref:CHAT domain-containing protein n=1 Tax=unclassified Nostoc TaxID=2593658 RepID=UPI002AD5360D|nr:CHAT domain-containing protein [Nostoc sp. DedQUE03]MDZ7973113.1 CHAT domain-containing protein [Nostoc sp. DedQUE03]MDZ8046918.1 CHAT domain-containing protein [Nostoc sp. DedQUE02]
MWNAFSLSRYLLLLLVTAFIFVTVSPVLKASHAIDLPIEHFYRPEESLKDLLQQGKALYEAGRLVEAQQVLQKVFQEYQALGDKLRQAVTLSNLALVSQQRGMFAEANTAINDSLQLLGTQNSKQYLHVLAQTLEIQGSIELEQGQPQQALQTWQQAQAEYTASSDCSGINRSQINQAQALQVLGFYRRALTMLTQVSQNLQSQPDSLTKVIELRSLGDTLQLTGDLEKSRQVLQQSLQIAEKLQSLPEIGATLLSLGNTARIAEDYQSAIAFYQQAIVKTPSSLTKVQAQINLLTILLNTKQWKVAQPLLKEIPTELDNLPLSQVAVYARIHFAQSLIKQQSVNQSKEFAAKMLAKTTKLAQALGDRRAESYAIGTLGKLYEQNKQLLNAQNLTQQALKLAESVNAPDIAYNWYWQLGRLLKQQGDIRGAIAAYDAAVNELQSLRNDLFGVNRDVEFSFKESVEPIYRESVALLLSPGDISEETLDKARQRIEALQLADLDNFFREACLNVTKVILDEVVDRDNPTTAVIYPIILPEQLQIIIKIPTQPLRRYSINKSQIEVEKTLGQLRQYLTEPDRIEEVKILSKQVYNWLIQPIESELQHSNVNTLAFVLDGALRNVPMAALYDGKQYLVEKYAVALNLGLQLQKPKPLAQENLQVLVGGLVQPPSEFRQFPSLPEIKSEFNLIAKTGVATTKLLDKDFTSQELKGKISSIPFNIVHLATHGQFSSRLEETFILAADGPINVTDFDLLLRRRDEIYSQPLELLVLSACQTAEGDNRATLGLAGVAVRAGARSTMASLWNVGDRSTAILVGEFYRELVSAKVTKAEALRRAQVTLLQKYPNYSRPGYWAAYVLVGNWL